MRKKLNKILQGCICLILIIASLTGCQREVVEEKESINESQTPTKTLTMAVGAELTTLYPLNMDEQNLSATRLCYEGLVFYEDGEVKPWLAKTWKISEDGRIVTFNLREDVTFHDGEKFNAEAIKVNFEFKQNTPNFRAWPGIVNVKEVEVVDEFTVAFHYDTPFFAYLLDFSFREIMVCVSPRVIDLDNFQTLKGVVGTGPYIYDEVKSGEYVKFKRNENYWGEKPVYDEILVKYIPEASSRLLALQKGEIDMIYGNGLITWDDYNQGIASKNVSGKVSKIDSKTVYFVLNAGNPALRDHSVREAIAYGIDKKSICDGLTYGNQKPASDMFPEGNFLSDVEMNVTRDYDLLKAKNLLEQGGWLINETTGFREKNGQVLSFKLTYNSGDAMNKLLSSTIKSQLKGIGIDAVTEGQDMMTWWKEGVLGNYGMIIWGTEENTSPHINFPKMLKSSPHTPSLKALEGNEAIFLDIENLNTIGNIDEARNVYQRILNFNNDHVVEIPLYYVKDMILYNNEKIKDYIFTDTPVMFEIDNIESK